MTDTADLERVRRILLGLADFFELLVPKLREYAIKLTTSKPKRRAK